jgi:hypothetical protein
VKNVCFSFFRLPSININFQSGPDINQTKKMPEYEQSLTARTHTQNGQFMSSVLSFDCACQKMKDSSTEGGS